MSEAINKSIYQKLCKLIPNLPEHLATGKEYGTSKKELPLLNLSYDFLCEDGAGEYLIALSHHYEMNGDLVPDPDMEIRIIPEDEMAQAVSFQNIYLYQNVNDEDGKRREDLQKDLDEFLNQWIDNSLSLGHSIDLSRSLSEHLERDEPTPEQDEETRPPRVRKEKGKDGPELGR